MIYFKNILIKGFIIGVAILFLVVRCSSLSSQEKETSPDILAYEVEPHSIQFYYKNKEGVRYQNYKKLKTALAEEGEELLFAMNGGMYTKNGAPKGLYIENGKIEMPIDRTEKGYGNFYLQPNGVLYLTSKAKANIVTTENYKGNLTVKYATQSGPMLLTEGNIHSKFNATSTNLNIRNGVGILPNGNLLFALSTNAINFYTFAKFFKDRACENALYLDGFVSRMYLPSQNWIQEDGDFGVIIGQAR